MSVLLETTAGDITIDLFIKERPRACLNFLKLCKVKYYNYCCFFNVRRDFIAQTGDPTDSGTGGESIFGKLYGEQAAFFEAEVIPPLRHSKMGLVSMACRNGKLGSQFFITLGENQDYLDEAGHCVFGEVVEGSETLTKINEAIVDNSNRPYIDIRIAHTVILDDPYDDPKGLEIPRRSPSPTPAQLESGRLAADELVNEGEGLTKEELEEKMQEKEAKARAQILEMVGDLPDADVKPPDNVLFVCKLNPVTTDEDLMIIFSRFGPIKKCEVIRDKKSGESLQYAFVEFEDEDHCANAYFKMDNVLIDDRRIHVDFSQSVSKLDWVQNRQRQPGKPTGPAPSQDQRKTAGKHDASSRRRSRSRSRDDRRSHRSPPRRDNRPRRERNESPRRRSPSPKEDQRRHSNGSSNRHKKRRSRSDSRDRRSRRRSPSADAHATRRRRDRS